jgi:hypothetical protein
LHHSPSSQHLLPESQSLHNSSVLTKFVTDNTQTILNQYLRTAPPTAEAPAVGGRRPNTTHLNSQKFHCARAVSPSLQAPWHDELKEQQKALRTVFHSQNRYRHSPFKPQRPPPQPRAKRESYLRSTRAALPSSSLAVAPTGRSLHRHHYLPLEGSRAVPGRERETLDCDSVSEIQSVLNEMSQSQEACLTIQPLERYNTAEKGEPLDEILSRLEQAIDPPGDHAKETGRTQLRTGEAVAAGEKDPASARQGNPTPRLLLISPRIQLPPTSLQRPAPRVCLPAVDGPTLPSEASPLNSLSIATLPLEGKAEQEARRTMSRRILHTHQRPAPTSPPAPAAR